MDYHVTLFDDIQCSSSNLLVLLQCVHSTIIDASCTDGDDVSVNCSMCNTV